MMDFTSPNTKAKPNNNGLGQFFGGLGWPKYYNPNNKALLKIPSGASVLINSPLLVKSSPYDIHSLLVDKRQRRQSILLSCTGRSRPPGAGHQRQKDDHSQSRRTAH